MATEVASAYVELGANTSRLSAGLAAAGAQVEGFAKKADARAATASAAFSRIGTAAKVGTLAVAGGLALAVKSAANFDAQMSQVKAVTGATASQMQVLRKAALDTSKSAQGFGYTAKDVAAAQVELGKAGLSTAQIIGGGMNSALTLARAGNLQLADSAAYVANAMQQFGMSGQQSAQVADALAQAANATTADVGDFGMALVQSGAAAKSAGLSFNQTMTALTALASTGVKGSDAGTSLKTSLIQLIKPTVKQGEAARAAGLSFIGAGGKMRDLADIAGQLRTKTQNLTQAQRTALFATLAGTDGVRTLLSLYNAGPVAIAKYSAQLAKQGTAQSQAATMSDNAAGKFKQLMATLQAAGIEIGTALLPPLAAVASGFAKVISSLTAFKPIAYAAAAAVTVMIAAFAISKVVGFAGAIGTAAKAIAGLGAASAATSTVGALGGAAGGAAGRMGALAGAIPLVANPIGALTVGVGLGIAALFAFRNEMSAGERVMQGLSERTSEYRTQVTSANQVMAAQAPMVQSVIASSRYAAEAKKAQTQAELAYITALNNGRKAGESEAQFQQRLSQLYVATAKAKVTSTTASNQNTEAIRKAVDGTTKLRAAGDQELATARARVQSALAAANGLARYSMTAEQRAKVDGEVALAQANLGLAEARRTDRLKAVAKQQEATRNAIKNSSMTDAEKQASLDIVNRELSRTRTELKKVADQPDPKKSVKVDNTDALLKLDSVRQALAKVVSKSITVTVNTVGSAVKNLFHRGGYVTGYASGGMVSGPGGKDKVPAMLTAGEAVLTKRQQALVNGGMSIGQAFRKTGARNGGSAFAKGGFVAPKRKKGEKDGAYSKRVKAARDKWLADKRSTLTPGLQNIADAVKGNVLGRFDRETQATLGRIEKGFTGTVTGSFGTFTGSLADADRATEQNLKRIERNFTGTFKDAMGNVVTGSFRDFDKQMRTAQASLTAFYDALTPAEAQIKAMQDQASAQDLAGAVTDAQAKLREAEDFGDQASIVAARKALDDAVRAQTIAGLQQTAEAERAQREIDRQAAQDQFDTEWEGRRTALQDQLDGQLEQERLNGEQRRALLQEQLDGRLQQEADNRDALRVQKEIELEQLGAQLLAQRNLHRGNFGSIKTMYERFANRMRVAGANIGKSIAEGLESARGDLRGAAAGLANLLADFLKTASPTKKGPMADLDKWMNGFAPALMTGLDTAAIEAGVASAVVAPSIMAGAGVGSEVTINLNVSDQTFAGMSREQADRVARQIQSAIDRQVRATI